MAKSDGLQRAYRILSGDDSDERSCEAIPDEACTDVPRNYLLNVLNGACTKLAEKIAGPNLVLPWLLGVIGAPAAMIGFLMPIKQTGSLAPQLLVSGTIRGLARRKWAWFAAGMVQAVALVGIAVAAIALPPVWAGGLTLVLLALFSVASGVGSVAFQDVTGKTIPKGRRGHLLSNRAAIGGVLTAVAGGLLYFFFGKGADPVVYASMVLIAAGLWALAAVLFASLDEVPGATEGGRNPIKELGAGLELAKTKPGYRRFLLTRALLLTVELAMPFYAMQARSLFGGGIGALGIFVVTVGVAGAVSSPVWGRYSDRSARHVMAAGALLGVVAAGCALGFVAVPASWQNPYLYTVVFIALGFAQSGVRLGRKTYLIDAAPTGERPLYVAFSNTAIGLVALAAGGLGAVAQAFGVNTTIVILAVLGGLGILAALAMPAPERMAD